MVSKRIIYTSLLIIWMVVIFMFSNQNGKESKSVSDKVTSNVIDAVEVVTKDDVSDDKRNNIIKDSRFVVRKLAHFSLYFILGILSYLTISSYNISNRVIVYSLLLCFLYACSDEIHQMFSDGRTFRILDIFIDTMGESISNFICLYFINRRV